MKKRDLEEWELAECTALKKAVDAYNAGKPRAERMSQGKIADALGMNQGSVSSYLNGVNALNARVAGIVAGLIQVPVESFSPRLAKEIAEMAEAVRPRPSSESISEQAATYQQAKTKTQAEAAAAMLEAVAALHTIQAGLFSGQLTEAQVEQIMRLRNDIVHRPASAKGQRLQGLLASAFKADENGGSPDDLLKMYQRCMEKDFAKEGAEDREPGKKPARRT